MAEKPRKRRRRKWEECQKGDGGREGERQSDRAQKGREEIEDPEKGGNRDPERRGVSGQGGGGDRDAENVGDAAEEGVGKTEAQEEGRTEAQEEGRMESQEMPREKDRDPIRGQKRKKKTAAQAGQGGEKPRERTEIQRVGVRVGVGGKEKVTETQREEDRKDGQGSRRTQKRERHGKPHHMEMEAEG